MNHGRQIVWDTETTGLSHQTGDKIIEVACIEIDDLLPTGREFYRLIDPLRPIPADATRVHGYTDAHVRGKPTFPEIARDFLEFIGDLPMIAHNASFDMGFINAELRAAGLSPLANPVIDTVAIARSQSGGSATLDALCRRFNIDISMRKAHDALLDTRLLCGVYLNLMGGRHRNLDLARPGSDRDAKSRLELPRRWEERPIGRASEAERAVHSAFVGGIKDSIWSHRSEMEALAPAPGR